MEELFENRTKYTQKEYDIFLKSYANEYSTSENLYMLFNFGFFGLCMIIAFIEKEIVLAIGILVGLGIYFWYKLIRPAVRTQKTKKSNKLNGEFTNIFKFYQRYFDVQNPEGKAKIYYAKIYRVVETKQYYYIYLTREHAFIISKIGFTKGNVLDFTEFMKKKVFFKYKNRMKKN